MAPESKFYNSSLESTEIIYVIIKEEIVRLEQSLVKLVRLFELVLILMKFYRDKHCNRGSSQNAKTARKLWSVFQSRQCMMNVNLFVLPLEERDTITNIHNTALISYPIV